MTRWITSDLHFGHTNILKFNPETRKYKDVADMNEQMVLQWNRMVDPGDEVFILGDFAFLPTGDAAKIAFRLFGKKTLVVGNHDHKLILDKQFCACFSGGVHNYLEVDHKLNNDKQKVVMFHYPIAEWNRCHRGSVHFHGHLHGAKSGLEQYRVLDVGMDNHPSGDVVQLFDDAFHFAMQGEIKTHGDGSD